ncbi:serine/threonine protein kinase [Paenibacillus hexagrammi]|uniref:Serine/threonine protein kinase n=1 Tax=Paenibacillus hexagrammi TaxID=2908839 RepID=A0ABY3SE04_9BACL|nr:serine/threonine-protein kinase [Paenibacillus sp. YPD9-1]UJF32224.1 serine/threonine protein kinase [Paenibacillus sp. YPD9-1]
MGTADMERCLAKGRMLKFRYKIHRPISCGELSIVYMGRDIEKSETVIIKEYFPKTMALRDVDGCSVVCSRPRLKPAFDEWQDDFAQEGQILQGLQHKHVVKYRDQFQENGTGYIVTEYCRGVTLSTYKERNFPQEQAKFWGITVPALLEALQYIHDKGIIHRDLKPGNVLVTREGLPCLIDLGSALDYRHASTRRLQTTPGFSPLEFHSKSARLGPWSDYYSLSAILYYAASGMVPPDVADRVIEDPIRDIQLLNSHLSARLGKVIMAGLSLSPKERPSSLRTFITAVRAEKSFRNLSPNHTIQTSLFP